MSELSGVDSSGERERRIVFLVTADLALIDHLYRQLHYSGYRVQFYDSLADAVSAAREEFPDILLYDGRLPEGNAVAVLGQLREGRELPVIAISDGSGLAERIRAIRVGADAFVSHPVDVHQLTRMIDGFIHADREKRRVLIVEPDPDRACYYGDMLEAAGLETQTILVPLEIMDALFGFQPDLILMNLVYPDCLGIELATVVRQEEIYRGIPIVFISEEDSEPRFHAARRRGGDEVLMHPVSSERLISSVGARADRARVMRAMLYHDSLTGLLNHASTFEKLHHQSVLARKRGTTFTFAMFDIDKFKRVNDTYGHGVGDRVIQSLGRFLRQSMRPGDAVGRLGGEEFGVILIGMEAVEAVPVFRQLLRRFARIVHRADEGVFSVTMSCGVAAVRDFVEPKSLAEAADRALYQAKQAGGNRVARAARQDRSAPVRDSAEQDRTARPGPPQPKAQTGNVVEPPL